MTDVNNSKLLDPDTIIILYWILALGGGIWHFLGIKKLASLAVGLLIVACSLLALWEAGIYTLRSITER